MQPAHPPSLSKRATFLWLLLLLALFSYVSLHGASLYYYNPDEATEADMASGTTLARVLRYCLYGGHPPLSQVLHHYWGMISRDPFFMRSLSLILSLATILVYYRIGARAAGPLAGLFCAMLWAMSTGGIMGALSLRNYPLLGLALALSYHYYLQWRAQYRQRDLWAYGIWAGLACMTHLMAAFFVMVLGVNGLFHLPRNKGHTRQDFFAVHILLLVLWCWFYLGVRPFIEAQGNGVFEPMYAQGKVLLFYIAYPLVVSGYLLPGYAAALLLLLALMFAASLRPGFIVEKKAFNASLFLLCGAFLLGDVLFISRIYPLPGSRHTLWIQPFLILPCGWMLADAARALALRMPRFSAHAALAAVLLALLATYDSQARFADWEYAIRADAWDAAVKSLAQLGPKDVIIAQRSDASLLTNIFSYLGPSSFSPEQSVIRIPYAHTDLVFDQFPGGEGSPRVLLSTASSAFKNRLLEDKERLVFLGTGWSFFHLLEATNCDALHKDVTVFPPQGDALTVTSRPTAVLISVSREEFFHAKRSCFAP